MQHYQLDPRRYYPNAQEQSVLIPYLRKYFKYPERSPERNRIASEVSQMLLKISPHWTHRAVRLWFNNNRLTYLKNDDTPTQSNPNFSIPEPELTTIQHNSTFNDIYITPNKPPPTLHNQQITLPSIDSLVSSSSIPMFYSNTSSLDEISSIVGSNSSNSLQDNPAILDSTITSLISEANLYTNNIERIKQPISKLNGICSHAFNLKWPIKQNLVEFPPRQFSLDLSCLLNNDNQIWQNKKYTDETLPKIDLYLTEQKIDSFIINNQCFCRKNKQFIQVTDKIPTAIIRYTTSNNFIWATTESKELYRIDITPHQSSTTINDIINPSSSPKSAVSDHLFEPAHVQLPISMHPSQTKLVPFDDYVIIYSNESPSFTLSSPDMKLENLKLQLLSYPLSIVKVKDDKIAYGMKNTIAFAMNDLSTGQLIRHFIGHSKPVNQLQFFNSSLLVSAGKGGLVRLWDIRNEDPIMTIKSTRKSCKGITGNQNTLITCFDESINSCINITDLRSINNYKPLLAFELDNVNPMTLNYNIDDNSLNLFLIEMRPQIKINYKYRTYDNLLS